MRVTMWHIHLYEYGINTANKNIHKRLPFTVICQKFADPKPVCVTIEKGGILMHNVIFFVTKILPDL